jgi:hypothetical protein
MSNVRYAVLVTTDDGTGSYINERNERAFHKAAPLPPLDGMATRIRYWTHKDEALEAGREAMARNRQAMSAAIQGFIRPQGSNDDQKVSEEVIGCGRVSYEYPDEGE